MNRYEGSEDMKKKRVDLLKKQFSVFRYGRHEDLEQVVSRFYHLLTTLDEMGVSCYT